ncbi:hypothetical protein CANCADRAFT_3043 [Tortispora caseinolytica NRRL Y-17796]|uniref:Galactose-1-phosphate uridylyltransferase n=1 Tax=Tortispora caseinolytica NRRL Y-17796 TaxID=767744 RepID=A0A1E4THW3_9ASCO|nr:hypothetical protein CANCADRAFT_3043 [Tortispora caseinolytica NRRL Y-17796]
MDEDSVINDISQRRYNPLTDSWVLVSPHRAKRPWQGQQEVPDKSTRPPYDAKCYLCPRNTRAEGAKNDDYKSTYVFMNDFAALKEEQPAYTPPTNRSPQESHLFQLEPVTGKCYVICFSPRHDLTLAQMPPKDIEPVIRTWQTIYKEAVSLANIAHCQIFENKGAMMGCSNPHPHGQVWMSSLVPEEPAKERAALYKYYNEHGTHMLEDYAAIESKKKQRVVFENDAFIAVVPFWAVWPYEVLVLPRRRVARISDLTPDEVSAFAQIISQVTVRYDNLFSCSFPYSMGIHQACTDASMDDNCDHLHMHFYPPLLRSATVRKFLVGFELMAMPQRDITAEIAAGTLRTLSAVHYLDE